MQDDLSTRRQPFGTEISVDVACQQQCLKDQQARRPDRGRPSEPRYDVFAQHGLDLEQQKGAAEYRESEDGHYNKIAKPFLSRRALLLVSSRIPYDGFQHLLTDK